MTSPEEGNWLFLGRALTTVFCQGLRPFVKLEMEAFYMNLTAAILQLLLLVPAPMSMIQEGRRTSPRLSTCAWAKTLQAAHFGNRPNWK